MSCTCTVEHLRWISETVFVLRFSREGLVFQPGQYLSVGPAGDIHMREYSIYSTPEDAAVEILVKEVPGGHVTPLLRTLKEGDSLLVDGPFGFFTVDDGWRDTRHIFIATGTGISPFHCFTGSYPGLDYHLYHGISTTREEYEYHWYDRRRITTCVSREPRGDWSGRVTALLREKGAAGTIDPRAHYYLCGNCDMIYEAFDILQDHQVPHSHLFAEVYY